MSHEFNNPNLAALSIGNTMAQQGASEEDIFLAAQEMAVQPAENERDITALKGIIRDFVANPNYSAGSLAVQEAEHED